MGSVRNQRPYEVGIQYMVIVFLGLMLFACSSRTGSLSPTFFDGNVRFDDVVSGEAKAYRVLGVSNYKNKELIHRARLDLYRKRPLGKSQNYANMVLDMTHTHYFLFEITTAKITADIVTLKDQVQEREYSPKYDSVASAKFIDEKNLKAYFKPGDKVYYPYPKKWSVIFVADDSTVLINRKNQFDEEKARLHHRELMKAESRVGWLEVNQQFEIQGKQGSQNDTVVVIGFNYEHVFLKNPKADSCCEKVRYENMQYLNSIPMPSP